MYYERKQDKQKYKHIVVNNLKYKGNAIYGETDTNKKTIKINKNLSKKKPTHKRPITKKAHKYPEVADTIYHEIYHSKHPKATEKTTYKKTRFAMKKLGKKAKQKLYAKFR